MSQDTADRVAARHAARKAQWPKATKAKAKAAVTAVAEFLRELDDLEDMGGLAGGGGGRKDPTDNELMVSNAAMDLTRPVREMRRALQKIQKGMG